MAWRRLSADNVNAALRQRSAGARDASPIVAGALQEVVKGQEVKRGAGLKQSIRDASLGANAPAVAHPAYVRSLVHEAFTGEAFDPGPPVTALKGQD